MIMLHKLDEQQSTEVAKGFFAKFVHSEKMTISYMNIDAKAKLQTHSHIHEQISSVITGEFKLVVDDISYILKAGDVFSIPSNVPHSGEAITDCYIIDVFTPVREDFKY